jgi:hypothetical protein
MTYERESEVGPYPFVFYFFFFPYLSSSILLFTKTHTNTAGTRERGRERQRESLPTVKERILLLLNYPNIQRKRRQEFSSSLLSYWTNKAEGEKGLLQIMRIEKKNAESFLQETNQKEDEGERGLSVKNEEGLYLYLFTNQ